MSYLQRPALIGLSAARPSIRLLVRAQFLPLRSLPTKHDGAQRNRSSMSGGRGREEMVPAMTTATRQNLMHSASFLIPGTFVPQPFSRVPKSPGKFFKYQFERITAKAKDFITIAALKFSSMESMFKRPRLKLGRRQIIPTAKALHQLMGEAIAAGDLPSLREICVPGLYETLAGTIARRKRNERIEWGLLKYNWRPRIVSHKVIVLPPITTGPLVQQAVIAISTKQSLRKFVKEGDQEVERGPGSAKTIEEYVVLTRIFDQKTWRASAWKVFGNTKESTLEDWKLEQKALQLQQEDSINKK